MEIMTLEGEKNYSYPLTVHILKWRRITRYTL